MIVEIFHCERTFRREKMSVEGKIKATKPLIFKSTPSIDELKQHLKDHIEKVNVGKFKVGVVSTLNGLTSRYGASHKFKKLTKTNIFGYAKHSVALEIEEAMKTILADEKRCLNSSLDNSPGTHVEDEEEYSSIVYLAEIKENLLVCPHNFCNAVRERNLMDEHLKTHDKVSLKNFY